MVRTADDSAEEMFTIGTGDGPSTVSRERKLVVDYLRDQARCWDLEDENVICQNIASALRVNAEKIARGWHDPNEPRPDPHTR
jgi:hypothetical protein